jgi:hypothetical protein
MVIDGLLLLLLLLLLFVDTASRRDVRHCIRSSARRCRCEAKRCDGGWA